MWSVNDFREAYNDGKNKCAKLKGISCDPIVSLGPVMNGNVCKICGSKTFKFERTPLCGCVELSQFPEIVNRAQAPKLLQQCAFMDVFSNNQRLYNSKLSMCSRVVQFATAGSGLVMFTGRVSHMVNAKDMFGHKILALGSANDFGECKLDKNVVNALLKSLRQHNKLCRIFKTLYSDEERYASVTFSMCNPGNNPDRGREISAVYNGSRSFHLNNMGKGEVIIRTMNGEVKYLNMDEEYLYWPMKYPLLFPYGTPGFVKANKIRRYAWARQVLFANSIPKDGQCDVATVLSPAQLFPRVAQEFLVDVVATNEVQTIRFNAYNHSFRGANGELQLPSSVASSWAGKAEHFQESMAIIQDKGFPSIFMTMTCNLNWPEISENLQRTSKRPGDEPLLISRVFHGYLRELIRELRSGELFAHGNMLNPAEYVVYTVEYTGGGVPHAHIVCRLREHPCTAEEVDNIVCAEIPSNEEDKCLVLDYMIHGPCGPLTGFDICWRKNGNYGCKYGYPKKYCDATVINDDDGKLEYRRRNTGKYFLKTW